jgi:hypothetical protein
VSDYVRSSTASRCTCPLADGDDLPLDHPWDLQRVGSTAAPPASRLVRARRMPRMPPYRCWSTVSPASFWLCSRAGIRPIAVYAGWRPDPALVMAGKGQMRTLLRRARRAELRGGLGARG